MVGYSNTCRRTYLGVKTIFVMIVLLLPLATAQAEWLEGNRARFQALDKITARISTLDVPQKIATRFGTLQIYLHACVYRPPTMPPENAALIEIRTIDHQNNVSRDPIFFGWMFASSPAISTLEHPVYDVTVLSCSN